MKPFVKGEKVISYSMDKRQPNEELVVLSVGPKFITCGNPEYPYYKLRFANDGRYLREDWLSYRLVHSLEEIQAEEKYYKLILQFREDIQRKEFSLEEIELFYKIHRGEVKIPTI